MASIEQGRTPLRYSVAWKLHVAFHVSLSWLAFNEGPVDGPDHRVFPRPEELQIGPRMLFTEVMEAAETLPADKRKLLGALVAPHGDDIEKRDVVRMILEGSIADWLAAVPEGSIVGLVDAIAEAATVYLASLPKDPPTEIIKRSEQLEWARIRFRNAGKYMVVSEAPGATEAKTVKHYLTTVAESTMLPPMRLTKTNPLRALLERVNRLTQGRGDKTALAREFGVSPQAVSGWLKQNGAVAPTAETALRLLLWVEEKESKPNESPGNARTSPGPKTQFQESNEKKPKSGQSKS